MKDATELAIGVSSAGFEFDGCRRRHLLRVARVELGSTELEPVDEEPHPIPAKRLYAAALDELAEFLHRVGSALQSQNPDPGSDIKRCECMLPSAFQGRLDPRRV